MYMYITSTARKGGHQKNWGCYIYFIKKPDSVYPNITEWIRIAYFMIKLFIKNNYKEKKQTNKLFMKK